MNKFASSIYKTVKMQDNRQGLEASLVGWKRVECLAGAVEDGGLQFKVLHNLWD